ncbi:MAG: putative manganese-dependent inorganic diphosphatase, partial [Solirubrobacteraceae bacterium]
VRLGELNPQTTWVLAQAGIEPPEYLPHIMLRARDLMRTEYPSISESDPIREVGRALDQTDVSLVPVLDSEGMLAGVITTRTLARRYVRESRATSRLREDTYIDAVLNVLEGELLSGEDGPLRGRVWVHASSAEAATGISAGDVVICGDRPTVHLDVLAHDIALLILSDGCRPNAAVLESARAHKTAVITTPFDTYLAARMVALAEPCRDLMEEDEITATGDDLVSEVAELIRQSHHGAAVIVDEGRRPIGLLARSELVSPLRRRVILVDHAEQAQSIPGIDQAEIVEILDHHHIGSIETRVPVIATFDPVGSTATLVVERFRRSGVEPSRSTAIMLLAAVMSDTVILSSPTTTARDISAMEHLESMLSLDGRDFGRRMYEATSDVSGVPPADLVRRDAKAYRSSAGTSFVVAQVEVIGNGLLDRKQEILAAIEAERSRQGVQVYALMVTDVVEKGTHLLVGGDVGAVARAFGVEQRDGDTLKLPGVMSRKKQVAPKLLTAL